MGYKSVEIKLPVGASEEELKKMIARQIDLQDFTYQIDLKSLDARNKKRIHWIIRANVTSNAFPDTPDQIAKLIIPFQKRKEKVCVVGSGPAGFFAAYTLQSAGFDVTLIDRGSDVNKRSRQIAEFERGGAFSETGNYSFGEGGAGTFSDGKLTSRTKNIDVEKRFVIDSYVSAGAPEEIAYLASPHIGTNNLIKVVSNLREKFEALGGKYLFETKMTDISINNGIVESIETNKGKMDCDYLFLAIGHSAYDTYRLMINRGVQFKAKPFAIGSRAEHPQELINTAQWGRPKINGLKAADYKLTFRRDDLLPVYSFCMCPGGKVVPASPSKDLSIVNGMSYYSRNSKWANAAIVAGINLSEFLRKEVEPLEALDWLEALERKFFEIKNNFDIPAVKISDFLNNRTTARFQESSYPFELLSYNFNDLFPPLIISSLKKALTDFNNKIRGFSDGVLMGLESKTSSPVQALREPGGKAAGFANLFVIGEGSGHSGGIISSAVDGVKSAMSIL